MAIILCVISAYIASSWPWLWQDKDLKELELVLYTSEESAFKFKIDDANLSQKFLDRGFDNYRATKILVHGFADSGPRFCADFIAAYATSGWDVNLICIDWTAYADPDQCLYIRAVNNAIEIGKLVGQKIIFNLLIEKLRTDPQAIHVIGHSLGAHLAGSIGKHSGDQNIGRITGLDPAQLFLDSHSKRLSREDADFIDVIHANSGHLYQGCLSMPWTIGHVDFYPNGGRHMPGCVDPNPSPWIWHMLMNYYQFLTDMVTYCSHQKAYAYYLESIVHRSNDKYFLSKRCSSYDNFEKKICEDGHELPMGEALKPSMVKTNRGKYFLKTRSSPPFNLI